MRSDSTRHVRSAALALTLMLGTQAATAAGSGNGQGRPNGTPWWAPSGGWDMGGYGSISQEWIATVPGAGLGQSGFVTELTPEIVNSATGNVVLACPLISLPGVDRSTITLSATYNSAEAWYDYDPGPALYNYLGLGWTCPGPMYLYINSETPELSYLRLDDGSRCSLAATDECEPHLEWVVKGRFWDVSFDAGSGTWSVSDDAHTDSYVFDQDVDEDVVPYPRSGEAFVALTRMNDGFGNSFSISYTRLEYAGNEEDETWLIPERIDYDTGWAVAYAANGGGYVGTMDVFAPQAGTPAYSVDLSYEYKLIPDYPDEHVRYVLEEIELSNDLGEQTTLASFRYETQMGGDTGIISYADVDRRGKAHYDYEFVWADDDQQHLVARLQRTWTYDAQRSKVDLALFDYSDPLELPGSTPVYESSTCTLPYDGHSLRHGYGLYLAGESSVPVCTSMEVYQDQDPDPLEMVTTAYIVRPVTDDGVEHHLVQRLIESVSRRIAGSSDYEAQLAWIHSNWVSPTSIGRGPKLRSDEMIWTVTRREADDSDVVTSSFVGAEGEELGRIDFEYAPGVKPISRTLVRHTLGETTELATTYSYQGENVAESITPSGLVTQFDYQDRTVAGADLSSLGALRATKRTQQLADRELISYRGFSENRGRVEFDLGHNGASAGLYEQSIYTVRGDLHEQYSYHERQGIDPATRIWENGRRADGELSVLEDDSYFAPIAHSYSKHGRLVRRYTNDGAQESQELRAYDMTGSGRLLRVYRILDAAFDEDDPDAPFDEYSYDALGRVIEIAHWSDATTWDSSVLYEYSGLHDVVVTDENGHRESRFYDNWGRLVRVEESPDGGATLQQTTYAHDAAGNLTEKVDAKGNVYQWVYDSLGNIIANRSPNTEPAQENPYAPELGGYHCYYVYDSTGELTRMVDAERDLSYTYDRLGRRRSASADGRSIAYVYDTYETISEKPRDDAFDNPRGRLVAKLGPAIHTYLYYDVEGRVREQCVRYVGDALPPFWIGYQYDRAGHLVTITYPDPEAEQVRVELDGLQRPVTLVGGDDQVLVARSYGNNIDGSPFGLAERVGEFWYGSWNGAVLHSERDRVAGIGCPHFRADYGYDAAGNLLYDTSYWYDYHEQMYHYDDCDRLLSATYDEGSHNRGYGYDASGNRTLLEIDGASFDYTIGLGSDRLEKVERQGELIRGFEYDDAGRTSRIVDHESGATLSYQWDELANRIAKVERREADELTVVADYGYDAAGRRVSSVVRNRAEGTKTTTWHLRASTGDLLFELRAHQIMVPLEPQISAARYNQRGGRGKRGAGNSTDWKRTKYYFLGGERVASRSAGEVRYILNDRLGSARVVCAADGSPTAYDYHPFGDLIDGGDAIEDRFLFTGGEYDAMTEDYHLSARQYLPRLGRFLSLESTPGRTSPYAFRSDNPLDDSGATEDPVTPAAKQDEESDVPEGRSTIRPRWEDGLAPLHAAVEERDRSCFHCFKQRPDPPDLRGTHMWYRLRRDRRPPDQEYTCLPSPGWGKGRKWFFNGGYDNWGDDWLPMPTLEELEEDGYWDRPR